METNKDFYSYRTVCDLIQMYGRCNRSYTDYSNTFILDSNFSDVLMYSGKYLPRWVSNAIKELKI